MACSQIISVRQWFAEDILATVTNESGIATDLWIYDWIQFIMVDANDAVAINNTATFVDKPTWKIKYSLSIGETAIVGKYRAYFKLMIWWVPKKSAPKNYFYVEITENLIP